MSRISVAFVAAAVITTVALGVPASAVAQAVPPVWQAPALGGAGESTIASGLREALTVGAEKAVERTGRLDGFFRNEAIKILMPESLRTVESGMRAVGLGGRADDFVLALNRAAERAAASAKPIFWEAIKGITIDDARGILTGGDTAATEYFRGRTEDDLTTAFRPIVEQATGEFGVTRQYKELVQALPFTTLQSLDIDAYVVSKALDGLFLVLGEEEKRIRDDPAARITAILRDVFGR
jgi:hypothetical protein